MATVALSLSLAETLAVELDGVNDVAELRKRAAAALSVPPDNVQLVAAVGELEDEQAVDVASAGDVACIVRDPRVVGWAAIIQEKKEKVQANSVWDRNHGAKVALTLYRQVTKEDISPLCSALTNSYMDVLLLPNNDLGNEGSAFATIENLKVLGLAGTGLDDEGARVLTDTLKANSTLQALYLSGNPVTDEGAKTIAHLLADHTTLKNLELGRKNISAEVEAELETELAHIELEFTGYR